MWTVRLTKSSSRRSNLRDFCAFRFALLSHKNRADLNAAELVVMRGRDFEFFLVCTQGAVVVKSALGSVLLVRKRECSPNIACA